MQRSTHTPVRYRVVVRGALGEHLVPAFEGLELETRPGESAMTGAFDQARLHGLLDRLRDLGIELISVNPVDTDVTEAQVTNPPPPNPSHRGAS